VDAGYTSPAARALWVQLHFLGAPPPRPFPGAQQVKPELPITPQTRALPVSPCVTCHRNFFPLGYALENFDPIGRWRVRDQAGPVDVSGAFVDGSPTNGVVELLPTEDKDPDETEFLFGSIASAINEGGTVVGQGTNQYGDTGVVWSPNGDVKLLMGLAPEGEYQYSWAQGVNNSNAVAGYAKDANGLNRAMLWQGDTATPLGLLWDQGESVAHDINDAGDIVGWGTTDDGFGKAFVVHNGTMTPLPRLDGTDYGEAFGINDDGVIIGQTLESGIEGRGFATLWMDGQAYNLESLVTNNLGSEWQLLGAFGLSDNGKIVGFGVHDGEIAAFLLTPNTVPEPATIGMLAFALPALATRRRHRR